MMTVKQLPFEWHQRREADEFEVVLEAKTIEAVITLMAQALIAVVPQRRAGRGARR